MEVQASFITSYPVAPKPFSRQAANAETSADQTLSNLSEKDAKPNTGVERKPEASVDPSSKAEPNGNDDRRQENTIEQRQEKQQQLEIKQLAARDREVRAHEQAHMAVGGQYAGAATYEFKRGPDGVNYAVGGEVPISTGKENTPEATMRKAQIIRRAALAPSEPSPQDRRVAALASQMEAQARVEIAKSQAEKPEETEKAAPEGDDDSISSEILAPSGQTEGDSSAADKPFSAVPTSRAPSAIVSYIQVGRSAEVPNSLINARA